MRLPKKIVDKKVKDFCVLQLGVLLCVPLLVFLAIYTLTTPHTRIINAGAASAVGSSPLLNIDSTMRRRSLIIPNVSNDSTTNSSQKKSKRVLYSFTNKEFNESRIALVKHVERGAKCLISGTSAIQFWSEMWNPLLQSHKPSLDTSSDADNRPVRVLSILVGAMKAGTTESRYYLRNAAEQACSKYQSTMINNNDEYNSSDLFLNSSFPDTLIINREVHYFDQISYHPRQSCASWKRNWLRYGSKINHIESKQWYMIDNNHSKYRGEFSVIWEKTPRYMLLNHVAVMLGAMQRMLTLSQVHSNFHDRIRLRVWMLVRNPTARIYSQYWQGWKGESNTLRTPLKFARLARKSIQFAKEDSDNWDVLMKSVNRVISVLERVNDSTFVEDWDVNGIIQGYHNLHNNPLNQDEKRRRKKKLFSLERGTYVGPLVTYMRLMGIIDDNGKIYETNDDYHSNYDRQCFRIMQSELLWENPDGLTKELMNWIYGSEVITAEDSRLLDGLLVRTNHTVHFQYPPAPPDILARISQFYDPYNRLLSLIWHIYGDLITFGDHRFVDYHA